MFFILFISKSINPLLRSLDKTKASIHFVGDLMIAYNALQKQKYNLVLFDLSIADVNWIDSIKKLKKFTNVVVLSSKEDSSTVESAFRFGAYDYIRKPIIPLLFRRRITNLIASLSVLESSSEEDLSNENCSLFLSKRSVLNSNSFISITDHYCYVCRNTLHINTKKCVFCRAIQPKKGWPKIKNSRYQLLGSNIDRFHLCRGLGKGATGQVYGAYDQLLKQCVAIKIIPTENCTSYRWAVIKREVRTMAAIKNKHVVAVHNVVTTKNNELAIVMELAHGESVRRRISIDGVPPLAISVEIARQTALGLHAAHLQGIVHCDVKPSNVIVETETKKPSVKVVDFGIAMMMGRSSNRTYFYGTPSFAAPEQIHSPNNVNQRTDVYGIGGLLYFMFTGKPPYKGNSLHEIMHEQMNKPVPLITEFTFDASKEVLSSINTIIQRTLAKTQKDRYPDMPSLISALEELQDTILIYQLSEMKNVSVEKQNQKKVQVRLELLKDKHLNLRERYESLQIAFKKSELVDSDATEELFSSLQEKQISLLRERNLIYEEVQLLKHLYGNQMHKPWSGPFLGQQKNNCCRTYKTNL